MTGGTHKSATQAGDAAAAERERARELGRLLRLGLGPGGEDRPRERSGPHAKQAETAGWTKIRMKMNFLSFSFSNFSKQIFKRFSNPILNLNQTTHLKNSNATA
jgi:hypothetical protein